jgi:aerobic C4-dicarboxylate transport protein
MMAGHSADHAAHAPKTKPPFWRQLGFQVAFSMLAGVVVGLLFPDFGVSLKIFGDIFLKLIKTSIVPLIFLTVVSGVAAAGDFKQVGRVGVVAVIYFEIVSTIALLYGLVVATLLGVGKGVAPPAANASAAEGAAAAANTATHTHLNLTDFVLNIFPDNFIGAFTKGEALQVMVLSLIFGAALLRLSPEKRAPIESGLNSISNAFFEFIHIIMKFAPIGAFGAMAYAAASNGTTMLMALAWLVAAYWISQIGFVLIVLGAVTTLFRLNLFDILRFIREEIIVVLGTSTSDSVLPRLLERLPSYGVSKRTVGLVLPTGYVFNLDGASIYITTGVIFLANAYHVHLDWTQLATLFGVMMLTSKGVATVAGGSFIVLATTVAGTGMLPLEGLAVLFGVYRAMSPANSTVNMIGNTVATVAIAKICGEYGPHRKSDEVPEIKV